MGELAGYRVVKTIFQGRRTTVFSARRLGDGVPVMIKAYTGLYPEADLLAQFRREFQIGRSIDSPFVIQYLALEKWGHGLALITEDCGGLALNRLEKELSLNQILTICCGIASGLQAIHDQKVMHKDISPGNIIWNEETGSVKILDFGLASQLDAEHQEVMNPNQLVGSLPYLSPEQTGRMNRRIDYRTDFYSAGATFYQLFCSQPPFLSETALEMIHAHLAQIPRAPCELDPTIPTALSHIIMKLLSKDADDRYQSAVGLLADLDRCRQTLNNGRKLTPFPLGVHEAAGNLTLPQKLYGREESLQELTGILQDVTHGDGCFLLITGHSGTGKSSFIREMYKPAARVNAFFAMGKFEQYKREPYQAVIQAFRGLFQMVLSVSGPQLEGFRKKLQAQLGEKERVIDDLIPEVPEILGLSKTSRFLEAGEAHGRIHTAFRQMAAVFAGEDHPLILFLDDLQWADNSSLELLTTLAGISSSHFLLIGTYRDEEVDAEHPLTEVLERIGEEVNIREIHLHPLDEQDLAQMLEDTLGANPQMPELVSIIHEKTVGNPFFVREFLKELRHRNLIFFNQGQRQWSWNIKAIAALKATENVVDLMLLKLKDLPLKTRKLLALCACMGYSFSADLLLDVSGRPPRDLMQELWPALRGGFIMPLGHSSWHDTSYIDEATPIDMEEAPLVFLHDRVQQASYELVPVSERQAWHLRIGRQLKKTMSQLEQGDMIFLAVEQLNAGREIMADQEERVELAMLNLSAGKRAFQAAAFQSAHNFMETAQSLFHERAWETHHSQIFECMRFSVECQMALARWTQAQAQLEILYHHANSPLRKADILAVRVTRSPWHFGWNDIKKDALEGLDLCGIQFPDSITAESEYLVDGDARIQAVMNAPDFPFTNRPLSHPAMSIALDILRIIVIRGYTSGFVDITRIAIVMALEISRKFGFSDNMVIFLYRYSSLLVMDDQFKKAYGLGKLSLSLAKTGRASIETPALCDVPATILIYGEALCESKKHFQRGIRLARDSGEVMYMITTQMSMAGHYLAMGQPLQPLMEILERVHVLATKKVFPAATDHCQSLKQTVLLLQGQGKPGFLSEEGFGPEAWQRLQSTILRVPLAHFRLIRDFWLDRPLKAIETAEEGSKIMHLCSGYLFVIDHQLLHALALTRGFRELDEAARERALQTITAIEHRMNLLVEACPANFQHKLDLIRAEKARIEDKELKEICKAYQSACESSGKNGFVQWEALGNELFGEFWLEQGMDKLARPCLLEARYLYGRWGATGIVQNMDKRHHFLSSQQSGLGDMSRETVTSSGNGSSLDLEVVMTAAQVIAQEIERDRLLSAIMRVMVKYAGASRGLLILKSQDGLTLGAKADAQKVEVLDKASLEDAEPFSRAMVHYVMRTGRLKVAPNSQNGPFRDAYLEKRPNLSILCAPIQYKKRILGLLYLENAHSSGTFNEAHIGTLHVLLAQTAISLENARLYEDTVLLNNHLAREMEVRMKGEQQIRQLNQELEARVQERTAQLKQTQQELVTKAHIAGMAEIATSVLHNIGNVLNSVGISTQVLEQTLYQSKLKSLNKANTALRGVVTSLSDIEKRDRSEKILEYYSLLYASLKNEQETFSENLERVQEKVELIKEIVISQRRYASVGDHNESLQLQAIVKEALTVLEGELIRCGVQVSTFVSPNLLVSGQRLKLFHVLMNLMRNAIEAMTHLNSGEKLITIRALPMTTCIRLDISDTGQGISSESLKKVFQHGFSTREGARGFGLHNCANAMTEMEGKIKVLSKGSGKGCTFTLELAPGFE